MILEYSQWTSTSAKIPSGSLLASEIILDLYKNEILLWLFLIVFVVCKNFPKSKFEIYWSFLLSNIFFPIFADHFFYSQHLCFCMIKFNLNVVSPDQIPWFTIITAGDGKLHFSTLSQSIWPEQNDFLNSSASNSPRRMRIGSNLRWTSPPSRFNSPLVSEYSIFWFVRNNLSNFFRLSISNIGLSNCVSWFDSPSFPSVVWMYLVFSSKILSRMVVHYLLWQTLSLPISPFSFFL